MASRAARKALWIFFVFAVLLGVSAGGSLLSIGAASAGSASAAPQVRLPLIIIPGMGGSRIENDPDLNGVYGEVWPNGDRLVLDPWDKTLLQLKLAPDGFNPFSTSPEYATVRVGDIIRKEYFLDYYASTIAYFTAQGYVEGRDLFACPYDWRKDLVALAAGPLPQTLAKCVDNALARNPEAGRVNLLAHSMGGLIARRYLADPAQAAKVQRLVTLGTPFLGAPKIALAIIDKLCFADGLGLCFSNPDVLHELIQDFPAGYEIAPGAPYFQLYPAGYLRRDWDADNDGRRDGALSPAASDSLLAAHNPYLMEQAHTLWAQGLALWATDFGAWGVPANGAMGNGGAIGNGGATINGVEVYRIAGDQHASIGTIVEAQTHPWYNPWGAGVLRYRTEVTNGDGTVPLRSADLRDPARGIDLSGQVPTYYFNLEHGELPKDPNVLALANAIFAGTGAAQIERLAPTLAARTTPLPLNGLWLTVDGPLEVEVYDALGARLSRPDAAQLEGAPTTGESIPGARLPGARLPGASITEMGSSTMIFLPASGRYTLHLDGQQPGSATLRLQQLLDDQVSQTVLYFDLPVTASSMATLAIDPAKPAGTFALDQDGNGTSEAAFPPSQVLDARDSQDGTPPHTHGLLAGAISPQGTFQNPVTVTLEAQDEAGGSGVARLEYSLDGGQTVNRYSGPFQIDPQSVTMVLAKAMDRAGNEESPLATIEVTPARLFLPLLLRPYQ